MTRKHLLIGISTAALAAGTAQAQNRDTTDARGNREFVQCTAGNSCDVDNQIDNNPNNDRNLGAVRASAGTNNYLFVEQDGDDNTGTIDVRGNNNDADIDQDGDDNVARINISGDSNDAYIGQFGEDNLGLITIVGNGNYSYIRQGSFGSLADNNQAVTNQNGTNLDSFIRQGTFSGEAAGFNNSATVTQTGTGSDSNIRQYQSGNIARVSMSGGGDTYLAENYSYITQRNTLFQGTSTGGFTTDNGGPDSFNNPDTGNLADVAIAGQGNQSRVIQNGVQNRAIVSMLGGGSTTSTAVTGPNGGAIAAGRRAGNSSTVNQTGPRQLLRDQQRRSCSERRFRPRQRRGREPGPEQLRRSWWYEPHRHGLPARYARYGEHHAGRQFQRPQRRSPEWLGCQCRDAQPRQHRHRHPERHQLRRGLGGAECRQ
jgi:hypothetical protein